MGFLSSMFDPVGAVLDGGNNSTFDSIFNPGQDAFGDSGIIPSFIGNADQSIGQGVDNFADNVGDVNLDELRNLGNHFGSNPSQLLTGVDPLATKAWNGVLGTNNTPWVNQYGGETNQDYANSAARGINTQDGQIMGGIANAVAGAYAGGELGNLGSSAYGSLVGNAGDAGNTLGGFTGANAGGAADIEEGGAGLGQTGVVSGGGVGNDAQNVFNLERGGSALVSVGAYNTASGVSRGAATGGANALNGGSNPWTGLFKGGLTGGINSGMDYAGSMGIDNPYLKSAFNGGITGGVRAGMGDESQTGYGALVGALGGAIGTGANAAGNWLSQPSGDTTGSGMGTSTGTTNWGNLATGLGNLYMSSRNNAGIQGQINNLNGLYAPNSPYAQQMQQALQRQDAASGRGSQYGTRAVELQAALANAASRNAPTLANLYMQQRQNRFGQLSGLLAMGKNSGAFNGLGSMFSGQQAPAPNVDGSAFAGQMAPQMGSINPAMMNQDYQNTLGDIPTIGG